jgi:hypothetical protein
MQLLQSISHPHISSDQNEPPKAAIGSQDRDLMTLTRSFTLCLSVLNQSQLVLMQLTPDVMTTACRNTSVAAHCGGCDLSFRHKREILSPAIMKRQHLSLAMNCIAKKCALLPIVMVSEMIVGIEIKQILATISIDSSNLWRS